MYEYGISNRVLYIYIYISIILPLLLTASAAILRQALLVSSLQVPPQEGCGRQRTDNVNIAGSRQEAVDNRQLAINKR